MKAKGKILAVVAAAACMTGLAGCSKSNNHISVDSYWYIDSYEGIQPSALKGSEEIVYKVTFDEDSATNSTYKVSYYDTSDKSNTFTTEFYATTFDWSDENLTYGDYRLEDTKENVYVLETALYLSGEYTFAAAGADSAENTVTFENYLLTITYFRSARNTLSPIYSKQTVRTTSPNSFSPTSAENMCKELCYEYEVFYNYGCTEATYTYTEYDFDDEQTVSDSQTYTVNGISSTGYTLFDNNTLYTAIRGMSLSSDFSATVSLFTPANMGILNCSITGGETQELDYETDADIVDALTAAYGQSNLTPEDAEENRTYINYNSVNITATGELHGTTQTAWYAAVEDEKNNQYHATMLYLAVPLSYGLGTLEYRLSSIKYSLDNPSMEN